MNNIISIRTTLILFLFCCSFTLNAQTYSFSHDAVTRSYIVHLPPSYDAINSYPLVINMHGYGSTASQEQFYTEMDAVADTANFIVVYPNGVANSWNSGQAWSYNQGINDVSFISALIDTMTVNFSIDTTMVYACGMSNGGFMSYRLACELENKIAAIASVTGVMSDSIYNNCQTDRPMPILHLHGTIDPTVAYNGTPGNTAVETGIAFWAQNNNCPVTPVITSIPDISITDASTVEKHFYGTCDLSSEVVLFKIIGGEHTWPGVSYIIGVTNQDINGSGEIWKFFRRHQMTYPISIGENEKLNKGPEVTLYPNPCNNYINVEKITNDANSIILYNQLGQKVREIELQSKQTALIVSTAMLNTGIYTVQIKGPSESKSLRFIKQ